MADEAYFRFDDDNMKHTYSLNLQMRNGSADDTQLIVHVSNWQYILTIRHIRDTICLSKL